jgi:carboxylesterase
MEKKPLGVLILHGFTGSLDTVKGLVPTVERLGLPYRMPVMRGHGTRYEDLEGVGPVEWYADAEAALLELSQEAEQIVVVGLSMGGLVTLNLALKHPELLKAMVLVAPALRFADPLIGLTPLLKLVFRFWDSPNSFEDRELAKACTNYTKFPTATFSKFLDYAIDTERRIPEIKTPALILHSRKDKIIHPISAKLLDERLGSTEKRVIWFEKSGHEMFQDLESAAVLQTIGDYLEGLTAKQGVA